MEEHYAKNQIQNKRNFKAWQGYGRSNQNHFENGFIKIFHLSGIIHDFDFRDVLAKFHSNKSNVVCLVR